MKLAKNLERLGTETAFSVLAEAKKLEAQGKEMIHLGLGQPDFMTPQHIMDAAKKAIDDGHHGYVMSNGIPECREAVTRWIKKQYNTNIDPERILIMPGGKPTMSYAIQCFGEPGAEIIHPTPAFPIYESMINYTGSTPVPYDLTEDKDLKFDPDKILSLITKKTRLLILINPNNPTGTVLSSHEIINLANINKDSLIVVDELYEKFNGDSLLESIDFEKNKIEERVQSVSETLNLSSFLNMPARKLTADQKQLISLGRGLVREDVAAVLMDEPLTVIDPDLKFRLRRNLKEINEQYKTTLVYVTHDQLEAMSLADRIAVMDGGEILQADEPNIIYNKPKTKFVASFIGSPGMNFFEVNEGISKDQSFVNIEGAKFDIPKQLEESKGSKNFFGIRPENLTLNNNEGLKGSVFGVEYLGSRKIITVKTSLGEIKVKTDISINVKLNENVQVKPLNNNIIIFDGQTDKSLNSEFIK